MQQERLDVRAQLGDEERRLVRHQAADEMHVTRQPIELGDGDGGGLPVAARCSERCGELRAAIEGVSALPRLDLDELGNDIEPLGLGEPGDGGALGVNPQARLALLARADPVVGDVIFTTRKMTWSAPGRQCVPPMAA